MKIMTKKINFKISIESEIERHPVPVLGIDYKVKIIYKNIKNPELDIDNKLIKIYIPNKYKNTNDDKILDIAIEKMYKQIAKVEIERAMEKTRILLGFAPDDYGIEKLKHKMAKCTENKIIINPDIVKYRREVIDYIVLYQYCKLKYKANSRKFVDLIKKYVPNYKMYEKYIEEI